MHSLLSTGQRKTYRVFQPPSFQNWPNFCNLIILCLPSCPSPTQQQQRPAAQHFCCEPCQRIFFPCWPPFSLLCGSRPLIPLFKSQQMQLFSEVFADILTFTLYLPQTPSFRAYQVMRLERIKRNVCLFEQKGSQKIITETENYEELSHGCSWQDFLLHLPMRAIPKLCTIWLVLSLLLMSGLLLSPQR